MSCSEPDERGHWGALEPWLVAALSGLDEAELERWRESGLLPASVKNEEPIELQREFDEPPHYYNWSDHFRVLAAAKLLELGLPEAELPDVLATFDRVCRNWPTRFVPKNMQPVFPSQLDYRRFETERHHEHALGKMYEFADVVEMDPMRVDGRPVLHRRRLDTQTLWQVYSEETGIEQLLEEWWITPYQARRAIEFEYAVRGYRLPDALAAG